MGSTEAVANPCGASAFGDGVDAGAANSTTDGATPVAGRRGGDGHFHRRLGARLGGSNFLRAESGRAPGARSGPGPPCGFGPVRGARRDGLVGGARLGLTCLGRVILADGRVGSTGPVHGDARGRSLSHCDGCLRRTVLLNRHTRRLLQCRAGVQGPSPVSVSAEECPVAPPAGSDGELGSCAVSGALRVRVSGPHCRSGHGADAQNDGQSADAADVAGVCLADAAVAVAGDLQS